MVTVVGFEVVGRFTVPKDIAVGLTCISGVSEKALN
jgi:hypothetical protein